MLKEIFNIAYEDMYKKWVIHKVCKTKDSIDLFYKIPDIFSLERKNIDNVLNEFETYINKVSNEKDLREEFDNQYNKDSIYSFVEFIFNKNNIFQYPNMSKKVFVSCYIYNLLNFLIEEYYCIADNKEEIIFNSSISNEDLLLRINAARKYNRSITYKFDKIGFDGHIYDILNYKMNTYLLFLLFIKKVSYSEGLKLFEEFFKTYELKDSDKQWNVYLNYKLILDCCRKKYELDNNKLHGRFDENFTNLEIISKVDSFEESFNMFLLMVSLSLDGIVCSIVNMSNDNDIISPYKQKFEIEYNNYTDYLRYKQNKSELEMCNYYNELDKDNPKKKFFENWKKTGLRPKEKK